MCSVYLWTLIFVPNYCWPPQLHLTLSACPETPAETPELHMPVGRPISVGLSHTLYVHLTLKERT